LKPVVRGSDCFHGEIDRSRVVVVVNALFTITERGAHVDADVFLGDGTDDGASIEIASMHPSRRTNSTPDKRDHAGWRTIGDLRFARRVACAEHSETQSHNQRGDGDGMPAFEQAGLMHAMERRKNPPSSQWSPILSADPKRRVGTRCIPVHDSTLRALRPGWGMGWGFNQVRRLLLGGVCLGGAILTHGGCASLVFDELSDMRDGGGGSASNGGTVVSAAKFGSSGDQVVIGAALDTQGRVVMAGMTLDNAMQDVGCDVAAKGGLDMFATWVNPNDLTVQCPTSRLLGGMGADAARGIAANPISGGVGIVGFSTGDFDCGNGGLTNAGGRDVVVAAFGGNNCLWQKSFGGVDDQEGQAIAFDSAGAAYIGGRFKGTLVFEQTLNSTIGLDAFIAKLSLDGSPSWSVQAGGTGDQEVQAIAVRAENTIIVGRRFSELLNFFENCPDSIVAIDPADDALFVASLGGGNTCKWLKRIAAGPQGDSSPISLAVGDDGDIFVAGGFSSRTLFPDQPKCKQVNDTQAEDLFVAKLDLNGDCQWSRRFGEANAMVAEAQGATAIAVDAVSNVFVTGQYKGSISFGEKHEFPSLGDADAFVLKLNSAGEHVWSNVISGTGTEYGNALVLDASGEFVFVAGTFRDGPLNLGGGPLTPASSDVFLAKLTR